MRFESLARKNGFDFTVWGMSITKTRNNNDPKTEPGGTPHDTFP